MSFDFDKEELQAKLNNALFEIKNLTNELSNVIFTSHRFDGYRKTAEERCEYFRKDILMERRKSDFLEEELDIERNQRKIEMEFLLEAHEFIVKDNEKLNKIIKIMKTREKSIWEIFKNYWW